MKFLRVDDISIFATSSFMMAAGFRQTKGRCDQYLSYVQLLITIMSYVFLISIESANAYRLWGDFGASLYPMTTTFFMLMPMLKIFILYPRRDKLFYLIEYLKRKFIHANYDLYEITVFDTCKRKCTFFVCIFLLSIIGGVTAFVLDPIIVNIGRNETDRELPFVMEVNFPIKKTPYFEIIFFLQVSAIFPVIFCYMCFDNFLCIMSLHVSSQFRILQHRMSSMNITNDINEQAEISNPSLSKVSDDYYNTFKNYVRQHQALVAYCDLLEEVFTSIVFMQMLTFSLSICLDGYQAFLTDQHDRQNVFFLHLISVICQLLMFTYSCDSIMQESRKVSHAAYSGPWTHLLTSESAKQLKKDLLLVTLRSSTPCYLTANGFFVVSLETSSRVLSTAASYFTLLKGTQNS